MKENEDWKVRNKYYIQDSKPSLSVYRSPMP